MTNRKIEFIELSGGVTRIITCGHGDPLIFVHGLGTQAERWLDVMDALADRYYCIAVDLYSHGFSDNLINVKEPQISHVQQLKDLIRLKDYSNLSIVGHSYGGLIVALLGSSLENAGIINRICLVASGSTFNAPSVQGETLDRSRENIMNAINIGTEEALVKRFAKISASNHTRVNKIFINSLLTANALPGRRSHMESFLRKIADNYADPALSGRRALRTFSSKLLIMFGAKDIRVKADDIADFIAQLENAKNYVFSNSGHAPMDEEPEEFIEQIVKFLYI